MSLWTGWSHESAVQAVRKAQQLNERLRLKDKEQLAEELIQLRVANNIQAEEIKILKTEIAKVRKRGVHLSGRVLASQERQARNQDVESVLVNPYDAERLKEEVAALKKEVNDLKEDNKVLRGQQEKYKKRAEYAKAKFYEVKDKELRDPL